MSDTEESKPLQSGHATPTQAASPNKPVAEKKDKQKVLNETFTPSMLAGFLQVSPGGRDSDDFRRLLFAYRGMPVEAFEEFVELFVNKGHDLQAQDEHSRTFLEYISPFVQHAEYQNVIRRFLIGKD